MNKHYDQNQKTSRYIFGTPPTPERYRKLGGFRREFVKPDDTSGAMVQRYRARWATPLDLYRDKQVIDRGQYLAGLQFGRSYHHAVSSEPACRERSRRIDSPASSDLSENLQQALAYVEQAYGAISTDTVNIMIDVCAYAQPATTPEALGKLRKGLGRLAREWGMASSEMCRCRKG